MTVIEVNLWGPGACANCARVGVDGWKCLDTHSFETGTGYEYLIELHGQADSPVSGPRTLLFQWWLGLHGRLTYWLVSE